MYMFCSPSRHFVSGAEDITGALPLLDLQPAPQSSLDSFVSSVTGDEMHKCREFSGRSHDDTQAWTRMTTMVCKAMSNVHYVKFVIALLLEAPVLTITSVDCTEIFDSKHGR